MGKHKKYLDSKTNELVSLAELARRFNISYCVLKNRIKKMSLEEALSYKPIKHSRHELYPTYYNMISRCYRHNSTSYKNYGRKGIKVCDSWCDKSNGFLNFLNDMGPRPPGYQLDRIDSTGDYKPENCRWVDVTTQSLNRGMRKSNKSGFRGVSYASYQVYKKWRAAIASNNVDYVIGYFATPEEAAKAYDKKAKELHGKEAKLNFSENDK